MTKHATHTPGPWTVEIGEDKCFHSGNRVAITVSGAEDGEEYNVTIAELWPANNDRDITDARLIAASPDMYEALEACHAYLKGLMMTGTNKPQSEAWDAFAKATAVLAKVKGGV